MSNSVAREKAVFCEAVEITDLEQRRQFLDQACGADKALRAQVEGLLALSEGSGEFFKKCAPALEAQPSDADRVLSAGEAALGTEAPETKAIGRYKLLQRLGEGGCGVVYMAEQEEPIRRRVALKIIKLGMDTKNVIARFEAERQALALMDHPNIARVLDAGATETGRPYFVMELVYGVKITEYCDQNRVSMRERLELFVQVCNAVQHAHQKGVIHRDLKPSNIMVTMHDGVPVPKVIDFGIAKATEQRLTDKTLFTSYAQLMGTPAYMSPEQMELSGLNLDTRSDIYSLGVLLYELLTGRTPFDTSDLLKLGVDELRRTVREQEPLSPSAKLQTLNNEELTKTALRRHVEPPRLLSQLRGDLDWIVLRCLEKDRTRRYATANALAMDIERFLNEEPVLARPPSQLYRLQKLVLRNRMVCVSGIVAAAALLLGTVISTLMFFQEREARISEAALKREAEAREKASRVASLVTQGSFEEADKLSASLPLNKPSVEVSAELRALGDWQAASGRWAEAAARFECVLKVNQLDAQHVVSEDQLKLGVALLKSGNRRGYEQLRQTEVAKLSLTNLALADRTFKLALLRPPDTNMLRLLNLEAEIIAKSFPTWKEMRPNPPHAAEWSEVLALLESRNGRFHEASEWSERCKRYRACSAAGIATASVIEAISAWRLAYYQMAVVRWTEACDLIQARSQQGLYFGSESFPIFPGAAEDLDGSWYEWMIADLLRRECDELFSQRDRSLDSMSKSSDASKTDLSLHALYRALGEWRAIRGEWEEARTRFDDVLQFRQPEDAESSKDYYRQGLTLLRLGDQTGFLRLRDAAFRRFKATTNEAAAQHVMELALLLPTAEIPLANLEPFIQVLNRAVAAAEPMKEGTYSPATWDLMLLGLLEYRRGSYPGVFDLCRRSLITCTYISVPTVHDRAILAMCRHKLGDDAGARTELEIASSLVQRGLDVGVDSWQWPDWVFARILLQEAEGLIPQVPLAEPGAAAR